MAQIQPETIPVLKITDLFKSYGGLEVLAGIRLEIHHSELHAIIG